MIRDQRLDLPFDRGGVPLTLFPSYLFDHLFLFLFLFVLLKILIKIRIFCCLGSEAGLEERFVCVCVCVHMFDAFLRARTGPSLVWSAGRVAARARAALSPRSPEWAGKGGKGTISIRSYIKKNPRGSLVPVAGKGTRLQERVRVRKIKHVQGTDSTTPLPLFSLVLEKRRSSRDTCMDRERSRCALITYTRSKFVADSFRIWRPNWTGFYATFHLKDRGLFFPFVAAMIFSPEE